MTLNELTKLSQRLTYKGKPCFQVHQRDMRNGWQRCPEGYYYMSIWIHAMDVDGGAPTKIESGGLGSIKDLETQNEVSEISHIKHTIIVLEMHEIDETMALDGVCVFNPHDNLTIQKIIETEVKAA